MIRKILIILLLPLVAVASDIKIPARDIIAAYPLYEPVENLGEIYANEFPTTRSTLIKPGHEQYGINLHRKILKRIPRYALTWMTYDKTAHQLIVRASPRYHYFLGGLLKKNPAPPIIHRSCAIYEVPIKEAKALTAKAYPDLSQLPPPVIEAGSQNRSGLINVVEKRNANSHLHLEWDCCYVNQQFAMTTMVNLTFTRFGRTREAIVNYLVHEPLVPFVIALGPTFKRPDHTLIAIVTAVPVSTSHQPLINGRICEEPSDFLVFAYGRFGRPISSVDPKGVEVIGYRVPPDFLPQEDDAAAEPQPAIMKEVRGTLLENIPLLDAAPYLQSRGIPFNDGDFSVFDPRMSTLHVRFSRKVSLEAFERLINYGGSRHGNYEKMIRCNLTTQSRYPDPKHRLKEHHHFYSIPSRYFSPQWLTIYEDKHEVAKIEFDATATQRADTEISLHGHFPLTKERNSFFRIEKSGFILSTEKPFLIDTGIDSDDGYNLWLEISAQKFHAELPPPR